MEPNGVSSILDDINTYKVLIFDYVMMFTLFSSDEL